MDHQQREDNNNDLFLTEMGCYVVNGIMVFIALYWITLQCQKNEEMYMKKRSLSLYYWLNISLMLTIVSVTMMFTGFILFEPIPLIITCCIGCIFLFSFLYLLLVKNWLLYYKYKWTYYTLELKWSFIINSKSASDESDQNWFIKNNKTYGNLFYIYRLFGVIHFIFFIIGANAMSFTVYYEFNLIVLGIGCSACLPIFGAIAIFYLYLVRHTPFMDDHYKIHWESKIHSKLLLLWSIFCGLTNLAFMLSQDFHAYLWGGTFMNFALFLIIYVSTAKLSKLQSTNNELYIVPSVPKNDKVDASRSDMITIDTVLSNESTIHAFMIHLSKEYSMELLLSYIEMTQFQKYILDYIKENGANTDKDMETEPNIELVNFPANIPLSEIIEGKEEIIIEFESDTDINDDGGFIDNAKIKAHKLYNKYVKIGSEFEINISSAERHKLSNLLDKLDVLMSYNMNLRDLLLLFQDCKSEMKLLQTFSLTRFKNDTEFLDDV